MGRMKEVHMEYMQSGTDKSAMEYLEWYYNQRKDIPAQMDLPCPNCLNKTLDYIATDDINCKKCGQEFILVDINTLRFK